MTGLWEWLKSPLASLKGNLEGSDFRHFQWCNWETEHYCPAYGLEDCEVYCNLGNICYPPFSTLFSLAQLQFFACGTLAFSVDRQLLVLCTESDLDYSVVTSDRERGGYIKAKVAHFKINLTLTLFLLIWKTIWSVTQNRDTIRSVSCVIHCTHRTYPVVGYLEHQFKADNNEPQTSFRILYEHSQETHLSSCTVHLTECVFADA